MLSLAMAAIGACMLALAAVCLRARGAVGGVAVLVAVICAGLAYDNLAVAAGRLIGFGDVLRGVNVPRYWIHALLTPLLIIACGALAGALGVRWPTGRTAAAAGALLVPALIGVGIFQDVVRLRLEPREYADSLRYANAGAEGPPVAAIVTIVVLIGLGALIWRTAALPWLLLGSIGMFAAAAVGGSRFWAGNLGELVLQAAVVATLTAAARVSPLPAPASGGRT